MKELEIDPKKVSCVLVRFIVEELKAAGFTRVVLGLSGGLDSSTAAYLLKEAVGPKNVWAVVMPSGVSNAESLRHAEEVVNILGINIKSIPITPLIAPYEELFRDTDPIRKGNIMARQRMIVLYDQSHELSAVVSGAGNKTELLLGYCTVYGDIACAFNPLGGLYKTQVRQLAQYLGLPKEIIAKTPSAELWQGQTDEDELGFSYEDVDRLLYYMIDKGLPTPELLKLGFKQGFVEEVAKKVKASEFKRRMPAIAKIGSTGA